MKVIHVLHELKFSGAEIMYVDSASFFQKKGCELTVLASAKQLGEYASFFEDSGYKVLHNPIPNQKDIFSRIKYYVWFIKLLKKEKFDVVHIHNYVTMFGLSFCAWFCNVKSIFTYHSVYRAPFYTYPYHLYVRWFAKNIFKCKFHTISDSVYEHELDYFYNKTNKVLNWYGNNRYSPAIADEKNKVRLELGIDTDRFVVISIGGCSPIKRHSEIIKALPIILKSKPNCIYLHLGCGSSEAEEIALAKELGVQDKIRFCGNQVDVRKYLIVSDVYLMTSQLEGISLTTIEAMACNIPAILYDVPGLRDFNKYGNNSLLIAEDYKLLADTVLNFDSNSETNTQAIKHVNQFYNLEKNANQIYNLYK